MKRTLLLIVGAAFLLSVSFAFGQETVPMYFNGGYSAGTPLAGGGLYYGSINGAPTQGEGSASNPGMICDDFYDHISGGEYWTAQGYQVSQMTSSDIANTVFGGAAGTNWTSISLNGTALNLSGAVQGYEALAYLVNQMLTTYNHTGDEQQQGDISEALWFLTTNAAPSKGTPITWSQLTTGAQGFLTTIAGLVSGGMLPTLSTYTGLYLYTQPFNPSGPQEMWGNQPVPEGGAALMYLLLAGVTCFGAMFYSRRQTMGA